MIWVYMTKKIKKKTIAVKNIKELTATATPITSQQRYF